MSSWFGQGLTSSLDTIKNQVSNSIKEVFEEEEPKEVEAQLNVAKGKIEILAKLVDDQKAEIAKLKERCDELSEQKDAVEVQKEVQCQQFRDLLKEKEEEINLMSQSFDPNWAHDRELGETGNKDASTQQQDSSTSELHERIKSLEERLRQERESHQNDLVALQEALSMQQTKKSENTSITANTLLTRWNDSKSDPNELENVFKDAVEFIRSHEGNDVKGISEDNSSQIENLNVSLHEKQNELNQVASKVKELEENVSALKSKVSDLQEQLQVSEDENKKVNQQLKDMNEASEVKKNELIKEKKTLEQSLKEEQERSSNLSEEVQMMEEVLKRMKDEKELLKKERESSSADIEELQERQKELRNNLQELESSLEEQIALNDELTKNLQASVAMNNDLKESMVKMSKSSEEHEKSLSDLKSQLENLQGSDSQIDDFKEMLMSRQEEMDRLKETLAAKNKDIENINEETRVYKKQYENLLEEYNQYLEDLETLQTKADNLEKLKELYEEEVNDLKEEIKMEKSKYESLYRKLDEVLEREKKKDLQIEKLSEKSSQLEKDLFKERSLKRELESLLEDKDLQIEELRNGGKEGQDTADEKDVDETEIDQMKQQLSECRDRIRELENELALKSYESDGNAKEEETTLNLREQMSTLSSELKSKEDELQSQILLVQSLQNEIEDYKTEIEDEASKFEEQSEQLRSVEAELEKYKLEISASNAQFQEHTSSLEVLQNELDKCLEEIETERQNYKEQTDELQRTLFELETTQDKLNKSEIHRTELQEKLDSISSKISIDAETQSDVHEERAKEYESLMAEYEQFKLRSQSELNEKQQQLVEASSRIQSLTESLEEVKASKESEVIKNADSEQRLTLEALEEKNKQLETLKEENAAMAKEISELSVKTKNDNQDESDAEEMTKEAVKKLAKVISEKDMEIVALKERNQSLVELIDKAPDHSNQISSLERDKQELYNTLTKKHEESVRYYTEIQRLFEENTKLQQSLESHSKKSSSANDKMVNENSNEIIVLKAKILELEEKLNTSGRTKESNLEQNQSTRRKRYFSDSLEVDKRLEVSGSVKVQSHLDMIADGRLEELKQEVVEKSEWISQKEEELQETLKLLREKDEELARSQEEIRSLKRKSESLDLHQTDAMRQIDELKFESENAQVENKRLMEENEGLIDANSRLKVSVDEKIHDLEMAKRNLAQITEMLEEKSQNSEINQQERLQNLSAINDLQKQLGEMKHQRDELQLQLDTKNRELTETRREVNNVIEKKKRLENELERLRAHLVAVEDSYTQEAIEAEERERELRKKLQITEEALRVSSLQHSTTSQEATQQLGTMERQLKQLQDQRDHLLDKLGKVTQEHKSQEIALENLTMVLEGFQREKENDLKLAERDYNERLERERKRQNELQNEIFTLKEKLDKANEGLSAASRLSKQLENKSQIITTLKQEMKHREDLLKKAQADLGSLSTNNAGKVDKSLVKNLVVGYVSADASKKPEVLKVVATVLDFNQEERQKTGLEGSGHGWLSGWLSPSGAGAKSSQGRSALDVQKATGLDQSLATAFVQFLEEESAPKIPLKLPITAMSEHVRSSSHSNDSRSSSVASVEEESSHHSDHASQLHHRNSPNPLLSATPMQTMPTFSVNRSSSSILKSVLHEENDAGGKK